VTPDICPNCGAEVPRNAKGCPECGSDETTCWSEEAHASGLDLPDDEFNYEEFVGNEFGGKKIKPRGIHWFWWLVAVGLIVLFAMWFFRL
jgi:hypothetical protein